MADRHSDLEPQKIHQIAWVVRDVDKTVANYWKTFGIGPWSIHIMRPPKLWGCTYMGKPSEFVAKVAFAMVGPTELELIEPMTRGDNVYADFLEEHGEGLHHLLFEVKDVDETVKEMARRGFKCIQSGHVNDGQFAYFDTGDKLANIWEVCRNPTSVIPDYYYPPQEPGKAK